jgi:hypothetical protein
MSGLCVSNAEVLKREHQLICMAEQIAQMLVPEGLKYSVVESSFAASPSKKWMVLTGDSSAGVAINTSEFSRDATPLTQMIDTVKVLCQVGQLMNQKSLEGLILSGQEEISESWRVFKVDFLKGALWLGVSEKLPWSGLVQESLQRYASRTKVHVKLMGYLPAFDEGTWQVLVRDIVVVAQDIHLHGRLRVQEGGSMAIEVADNVAGAGVGSIAETKLPVRLDLGEVEMSLAELAALRTGSVMELSCGGPLHCFLRVGSGEVRRGVLRVKGDKMELSIL